MGCGEDTCFLRTTPRRLNVRTKTATVNQNMWRRGWDSNPRYPKGTHALQACPIVHSGTPPGDRNRRYMLCWRRGWDSNPRYRKAVQRFSRPPRSTTPAPLLSYSSSCGWRPRGELPRSGTLLVVLFLALVLFRFHLERLPHPQPDLPLVTLAKLPFRLLLRLLCFLPRLVHLLPHRAK